MLLESLRALYSAPAGSGSIRKYLETPVRSTGGSGRCGCGFRTDLHLPDVSDIFPSLSWVIRFAVPAFMFESLTFFFRFLNVLARHQIQC